MRPPGGFRRALDRAKAWTVGALALARAWRWGAVLGRVLLAGLGLVVLGAIGRSALARNMLAADAAGRLDASLPVPVMPPPVLPAAVAAPVSTPVVAAAPAASPPAASASPPAAAGRATPDDPVYLNQATLADLHRLPGIGPKRAEAVLALRTKLGHFRQIEDLLKVKGIGRASLRKLRPLVRLDPPPATPPPQDGGSG